MANEKDRIALCVDHLLGRGDVARERNRRILDDADVVAVLPQEAIDALPAGAVRETAVNENDGPLC
jgi:hypothetical protein